MQRASLELGRPIDYREDTEELLMDAGFTDISHRTIRIPLHASPRDARDAELKRHFQSFACCTDESDGGRSQLFESLSLSLFTRQLRMHPDDVRSMCDTLRRIYLSDEYPLYHNM